MRKQNKKNAGHLRDAGLVRLGVHVCAYGFLKNDLRGEHSGGGRRDFSGREMRTSMLHALEYVPSERGTVITTRNSIYTAEGNLIKKFFHSDETFLELEPEEFGPLFEKFEDIKHD